ncbi:MAG: hypothetical protein O8C64_07285 [Candidatus Methanoperedens sp.]|nr:hypothetical protein [Candidatus Methanoperedens sp.]
MPEFQISTSHLHLLRIFRTDNRINWNPVHPVNHVLFVTISRKAKPELHFRRRYRKKVAKF